jgi:hypothetical protein
MRVKPLWKYGTAIVGATLLSLTFQGCGQYDVPFSIGYGTPTLVGPGDWNIYLNPAASAVEFQHQGNQFLPVDYIGITSAPAYATGFTSLTVSSVGPPDNGSGPVGSTSYAVQIPNYAFFWAPLQTAGSVQSAVPPTCPGADVPANFIVLKPKTGWSSGLNNGEAFGTMTWAVSTGATTINHDYNLAPIASNDSSTDMGSNAITGGAGCNVGRFSDGTNETFMGPSNYLVQSGVNGTVYFAVQTGTTPAVSALAANYSGILYQAGAGTNSALTVTLAVSGGNVTGASTLVSDVSTGASAGSGPTITLGSVTLSDSNASGFIAGKINFTGTDDPLVCLPQTSAGGSTQILLACTGEDDSANFVSLILVSH